MKLNRSHWTLIFFGFLSVATAGDKTVCHESTRHLIVEGSTGEVGTNFLVKHKSKRSQSACQYVVKPGDFEIKNERAEYFLGLQEDLLILDSGTGPDPRGLIIWDLKKRKKVYTGTYSEARIEPGYMEFWVETGGATEENCPDFKNWRKSGLGGGIETWARLSFTDFKLTKSSETRCSPRQ
jgi:hypothetical protein